MVFFRYMNIKNFILVSYNILFIYCEKESENNFGTSKLLSKANNIGTIYAANEILENKDKIAKDLSVAASAERANRSIYPSPIVKS